MGDIMGVASNMIEESIGGGAMFMNADAGDIDPMDGMCNNPPNFTGPGNFSSAIQALRENITTFTEIELQTAALIAPFGPTNLNFTFSRFENCTTGGPLDVCGICEILHCDFNVHMPSGWIENKPTFTSWGFIIDGVSTVLVSAPGEALVDLGCDQTILAGYSNNHMGYFATPDQYDAGGYESQLTFWGIETSEMVRNGIYNSASLLT